MTCMWIGRRSRPGVSSRTSGHQSSYDEASFRSQGRSSSLPPRLPPAPSGSCQRRRGRWGRALPLPSWCHDRQASTTSSHRPCPTCPAHRSTAVIHGQEGSAGVPSELWDGSIRSGRRELPKLVVLVVLVVLGLAGLGMAAGDCRSCNAVRWSSMRSLLPSEWRASTGNAGG